MPTTPSPHVGVSKHITCTQTDTNALVFLRRNISCKAPDTPLHIQVHNQMKRWQAATTHFKQQKLTSTIYRLDSRIRKSFRKITDATPLENTFIRNLDSRNPLPYRCPHQSASKRLNLRHLRQQRNLTHTRRVYILIQAILCQGDVKRQGAHQLS